MLSESSSETIGDWVQRSFDMLEPEKTKVINYVVGWLTDNGYDISEPLDTLPDGVRQMIEDNALDILNPHMADELGISHDRERSVGESSGKWSNDNPEYISYLVVKDKDGNDKIESGWEFREDAKDRQNELKEDGISTKMFSRRYLKSINLDPSDDSNWFSGVFQ